MTPGSIERVARIADGLNPIAISRDQLEALVTAYVAPLGPPDMIQLA